MKPLSKFSPDAVPLPGTAFGLNKRYYAIGEVSALCDVKAHVLRYWEQEFPQLKPVKRRGNRRYYLASDVETVQAIKGLLYQKKFTIQGARQRLKEVRAELEASSQRPSLLSQPASSSAALPRASRTSGVKAQISDLRRELEELLKRWPN